MNHRQHHHYHHWTLTAECVRYHDRVTVALPDTITYTTSGLKLSVVIMLTGKHVT